MNVRHQPTVVLTCMSLMSHRPEHGFLHCHSCMTGLFNHLPHVSWFTSSFTISAVFIPPVFPNTHFLSYTHTGIHKLSCYICDTYIIVCNTHVVSIQHIHASCVFMHLLVCVCMYVSAWAHMCDLMSNFLSSVFIQVYGSN